VLLAALVDVAHAGRKTVVVDLTSSGGCACSAGGSGTGHIRSRRRFAAAFHALASERESLAQAADQLNPCSSAWEA
jgi:hypothetical protein